jgi:hypothetical protein
MSLIVCVLILTKVDKVTSTNHIVSMKDEKNKINQILMHKLNGGYLFDLLQLRCIWMKDLVTYSYGNESYCSNELSIEEKKIPFLLL